MGHECLPVVSNMRDHQHEGHRESSCEKRGKHPDCGQHYSAGSSHVHRQWVLLRLRRICQSLRDAAPSPLLGRLRVGAEAQKMQGKDKSLRQQGLCSVSAIRKRVGKDCQEPPHLQCCHDRISVPVKILKNWALQHSTLSPYLKVHRWLV